MVSVLAVDGFSQANGKPIVKTLESLGPAVESTTTQFSLYLPLRNQATLEQLLRDQTDANSPKYHKWLTPAKFKSQFGPTTADMDKVAAELKSAGFSIVKEKTFSFRVQGSVWAVEKAFKVHLEQVKMPNGKVKLATQERSLTLPSSLKSLGAVIPEYTTRFVAHVHSARAFHPSDAKTNLRLAAADSFFYATDMRESYNMPSFIAPVTWSSLTPQPQLDGAGSTIGIVISSVILPGDVARAFNSTVSSGSASDVQNYSGNTTVPVPTVTIDPVLGGSGAFNANSPDSDEASLDTQMSLGTAPGAKEILYDMPDLSDASIIAAYTQVDEENVADVVSSSFGECELDFTAAANGGTDFTGILQTFHALFAQGNSQGITFVASSGDNGGVPCTSTAFDNNPSNGTNFVAGVENPASDPNVTAVGGTNLQVSATPTPADAAYVSENANYDPRVPAQFTYNTTTYSVGNNTWGSGGGYSIIFSQPTYQALVNTGSTQWRAVPDLSLMMGGCPGDADLTAQDCTTLPRSAAIVWIGGAPNLLIGTSSSAPQFAGVVALAVEQNGSRMGNVNPFIYSLGALQTILGGANAPPLFQYFHRNISGSNNQFTVSPGQAYSEVLGNGTLNVNNFLLLPVSPLSGTPNTPSNP